MRNAVPPESCMPFVKEVEVFYEDTQKFERGTLAIYVDFGNEDVCQLTKEDKWHFV
jgi:hypothetical protein